MSHSERERLRDAIAMAALQGMLAYSYYDPSKGNWQVNSDQLTSALFAYGYADAMLLARQINNSFSTPNGREEFKPTEPTQ